MLIVVAAMMQQVVASKPDLPKVYVKKLKLAPIFSTAQYMGEIIPESQVNIYSPIEGILTWTFHLSHSIH